MDRRRRALLSDTGPLRLIAGSLTFPQNGALTQLLRDFCFVIYFFLRCLALRFFFVSDRARARSDERALAPQKLSLLLTPGGKQPSS